LPRVAMDGHAMSDGRESKCGRIGVVSGFTSCGLA
jgi:hypothetical protein